MRWELVEVELERLRTTWVPVRFREQAIQHGTGLTLAQTLDGLRCRDWEVAHVRAGLTPHRVTVTLRCEFASA